jgi:hypothetical protein
MFTVIVMQNATTHSTRLGTVIAKSELEALRDARIHFPEWRKHGDYLRVEVVGFA